MSKQELKQKGFTIIEVVLVLAIAALIFLMVFIALPALQRNQRDTQRRSDAGRFLSQLSSYSTNNKGGIPADADTFKVGYLKWAADGTGEFNDPKTGVGYVITTADDESDAPVAVGDMVYAPGFTCDGEAIVSGNARDAAVVVKLEGSGNNCQNT